MTLPERLHAPSITLAQQALEIHDRKGEFAMLVFAVANMKPTEQPEDWTEQGYCELDDGSDIVHQNGLYMFGWHQRQSGRHTHAIRHAAMPEDGRPDPFHTNPEPALILPNRSHITDALLDDVERRAHREPERDGYAFAQHQDAYTLAPSLHHAVSVTLRSHHAGRRVDRYVERYVDAIARELADQAINLVAPDDLRALVDHAASKPRLLPSDR